MNAEFNWWLLIVGLVIGGGLVWLVLLDSRRREDEISDQERAEEAIWLSDVLAEEGTALSPALAGRVLELHAAYLATSMPADGPASAVVAAAETAPAGTSPVPAAAGAIAATADASPSPTPFPEPTPDADPGG